MAIADGEIRFMKLISTTGGVEESFSGLTGFLKSGDGEGDVCHFV